MEMRCFFGLKGVDRFTACGLTVVPGSTDKVHRDILNLSPLPQHPDLYYFLWLWQLEPNWGSVGAFRHDPEQEHPGLWLSLFFDTRAAKSRKDFSQFSFCSIQLTLQFSGRAVQAKAKIPLSTHSPTYWTALHKKCLIFPAEIVYRGNLHTFQQRQIDTFLTDVKVH